MRPWPDRLLPAAHLALLDAALARPWQPRSGRHAFTAKVRMHISPLQHDLCISQGPISIWISQRPDLWAKARPVLLPALAALPHGGRRRLPPAPSAHARLATGPSAKAIAAMADAVGPALGGAEAIEPLAQHGLVALRPAGRRFPVAVLHLPGQPGAPRRPSIAFEAP